MPIFCTAVLYVASNYLMLFKICIHLWAVYNGHTSCMRVFTSVGPLPETESEGPFVRLVNESVEKVRGDEVINRAVSP